MAAPTSADGTNAAAHGLDDDTLAAMSSAAVFDTLFAPGGPGMTPQPSRDGAADDCDDDDDEARVTASMEAAARSLQALAAALAAADAAGGDATEDDDSDVSADDGDADMDGAAADAPEQSHTTDFDVPPEVLGDADEDTGMGYRSGTAEASWGGGMAGTEGWSEEWTLERIVRRRKYQGAVGSFDADVAAEDMRWEYLCAWRGQAEATWERRAWLQDMGYQREVAGYDAAHPASRRRTRAPRPAKPTGTGAKADERARRKQRAAEVRWQRQLARALAEFRPNLKKLLEMNPIAEKALHILARRKDSVPGADSIPRGDADGDRDTDRIVHLLCHIMLEMNKCGAKVESISFVEPRTLRDVINQITPTGGYSMLTYHGTRPHAVGPISRVGLVVPGEGNNVKVANGSAFGIGIYTDTNPATPLNFGSAGGDVFVCIANKDPKSSAYKIFRSSKDVAPVLHLRTTRPSDTSALNFANVSARFVATSTPTLHCLPALQHRPM